MKEVAWQNLIAGDRYYIERINASKSEKETQSGKKVGIFLQIRYIDGVPFAHFNNLSDLPNATKPSGMGSLDTNEYSTLNYKFYKPSDKRESVLGADEEEIKMRETLIRNTIGNDDVEKNTIDYLGGKRKSKKIKKTKKIKKIKKI